MTTFRYDAEILTRYPTVVGGAILARRMTTLFLVGLMQRIRQFQAENIS
jgi:hypothetical protein